MPPTKPLASGSGRGIIGLVNGVIHDIRPQQTPYIVVTSKDGVKKVLVLNRSTLTPYVTGVIDTWAVIQPSTMDGRSLERVGR